MAFTAHLMCMGWGMGKANLNTLSASDICGLIKSLAKKGAYHSPPNCSANELHKVGPNLRDYVLGPEQRLQDTIHER